MKQLKLGVLASGRGSNFAAILAAIAAGKLHAQVQVVISNNPEPGVFELARAQQIPTVQISRQHFNRDAAFEEAFLETLQQHQVNFLVLAGYMKLLSPRIIQAYPNQILNIHPALLPAFGGKGMYGHFVHEAVLAAGCKITGVTVHLVNEEYDRGPIVLQRGVTVEETDTPESLAARVLRVEHAAYWQALQLFAEERVQILDHRVFIKPLHP
ncbi:phosphoribosylglycinamide formyltransferase [candidate division KSB1 bacterium]|nr:phosphoribosylglycinamide formyltransferase [candidate division KSB1 bacterium]